MMVPGSLHQENYFEAIDLLDRGKSHECLACADYNLTDPNLPRYYIVKNLVLIGHVTHDWYEAERIRREAESVLFRARQQTLGYDEAGNTELQQMREILDKLSDDIQNQRPEDFKEEYVYEALLTRIEMQEAQRHERMVAEGYQGAEDDVMSDSTESLHRAELQAFGSVADNDIKRRYEELCPEGAVARAEREEAAVKELEEEMSAAAVVKQREGAEATNATKPEEDAAALTRNNPSTKVSASASTTVRSSQQTSRDIGTQTHWSWMSM